MKEVEIVRNWANGVDLIVERDAGNPIKILTGNPDHSLPFWEELRELCDKAIDNLT